MARDDKQPSIGPTAQELAIGKVPRARTLVFRPYWWDALAEPSPTPEKAVPQKCDVAIVGPGFTGLSAALTLLRNGRQAVVFERGKAGYGASTRNEAFN